MHRRVIPEYNEAMVMVETGGCGPGNLWYQLLQRPCQLVRATGAAALTVNALQAIYHIRHLHTLTQFGNALGVAMAALGVLDMPDDVPLRFDVYLHGTNHRAGLEGSLTDTVLRSIADEGYFVHNRLLILCEVVFLPKCGLGLRILMGEVALKTRAEVDVPAPKAADGGFRILVEMCAKLAVLAGVFLFSHTIANS